MSGMATGWSAALIIVLVALLVHEPWRWLGLYFGRDIDVESGLFGWTRAVATALVAGLVLRLVAFPAGALAEVALAIRLGSLAAGVAIYWLAARSLLAGVAGSAAVLYAAQIFTL